MNSSKVTMRKHWKMSFWDFSVRIDKIVSRIVCEVRFVPAHQLSAHFVNSCKSYTNIDLPDCSSGLSQLSGNMNRNENVTNWCKTTKDDFGNIEKSFSSNFTIFGNLFPRKRPWQLFQRFLSFSLGAPPLNPGPMPRSACGASCAQHLALRRLRFGGAELRGSAFLLLVWTVDDRPGTILHGETWTWSFSFQFEIGVSAAHFVNCCKKSVET